MAMVRTPSSTPVEEEAAAVVAVVSVLPPQAARDRVSSIARTRQVMFLIFVSLLFRNYKLDRLGRRSRVNDEIRKNLIQALYDSAPHKRDSPADIL